MFRYAYLLLFIGLAAYAAAQVQPPENVDDAMAPATGFGDELVRAERDGVGVRIKDVARFRGVRGNQLFGVGLVVGLEGTGDTQATPFTKTLLTNALKDWGTTVDQSRMRAKNIAAVTVTAELPPFAAPGNRIDVTVQSIGDAKSLQGGFLLMSPLYGPTDRVRVLAMAQGAVSIGGFNFSASGSSVQKNHTNVGIVPEGAFVEDSVATQFVFDENKLYLELYDPDLTTAQRVADALRPSLEGGEVVAQDGGTIRVTLPAGMSPMQAIETIEKTEVHADIPAVVVVNERTGTIVIGGNVRLGPAVIAHGSLRVSVDTEPIVSENVPLGPAPAQKVADRSRVDAAEDLVQIGVVRPSATIQDLARMLQVLRVSARDVIAILEALRAQGALKARVKVQ